MSGKIYLKEAAQQPLLATSLVQQADMPTQSTQTSSWFATTLMLPWLLGMVCGGIIARLVAKVFYLQHRTKDRKASVRQSAATTLWYVSEKVAPLLPQFPYMHKDLVFLGKGVDYICFDGLSSGTLREIVFLEIKTGKSTLNANENRIKDAIDKGRVRRETLRMTH